VNGSDRCTAAWHVYIAAVREIATSISVFAITPRRCCPITYVRDMPLFRYHALSSPTRKEIRNIE
jgi:hypothetical protein